MSNAAEQTTSTETQAAPGSAEIQKQRWKLAALDARLNQLMSCRADEKDKLAEMIRESSYSANQKKFVRAAKRRGLKITDYSGLGMFGARCPSVYLDGYKDFKPAGVSTRTDSMGKGIVVYAQD